MPEPAYLAIENVDKAFGDHPVFESLSLTVPRGDALAIVGGSGTGKSVLLRMVVGLVQPDRGAIHFDGTALTTLDEPGFFAVRRRIAMMFQNGALFDSLDVGENVAYPLRIQLALDEAEIAHRVAEKLTLVGLPGIERQMPSSLSGGMRKRVAMARAIITEPEVLLFDEPTAGLDPPTTRKIDELIRQIHRELGITVIVVTHDLPSAYFVSTRIAMLAERRIVAIVTPDEFRNSVDPTIRDFAQAMA